MGGRMVGAEKHCPLWLNPWVAEFEKATAAVGIVFDQVSAGGALIGPRAGALVLARRPATLSLSRARAPSPPPTRRLAPAVHAWRGLSEEDEAPHHTGLDAARRHLRPAAQLARAAPAYARGPLFRRAVCRPRGGPTRSSGA